MRRPPCPLQRAHPEPIMAENTIAAGRFRLLAPLPWSWFSLPLAAPVALGAIGVGRRHFSLSKIVVIPGKSPGRTILVVGSEPSTNDRRGGPPIPGIGRCAGHRGAIESNAGDFLNRPARVRRRRA